MKANIDETGTLHIEAESPPEAFALKWWTDKNFIKVQDFASFEKIHVRGSGLVIKHDPQQPKEN